MQISNSNKIEITKDNQIRNLEPNNRSLFLSISNTNTNANSQQQTTEPNRSQSPPSSYNKQPSKMMSAIQLLARDHVALRAGFAKVKSATNVGQRIKALDNLTNRISVHSSIQSNLIHPTLQKINPNAARIAEASHKSLQKEVEELKRIAPIDPIFASKFDILESQVHKHTDTFEQGIFPILRESLNGNDLEKMAEIYSKLHSISSTRPNMVSEFQSTSLLPFVTQLGKLDL